MAEDGPLHPLTGELAVGLAPPRAWLQQRWNAIAGAAGPWAVPLRMVGETPLVMSRRLHAEVDGRVEVLCAWLQQRLARGAGWGDAWGDIGPPDVLAVDLAIAEDAQAPGGWSLRWVEFQAFSSVAASVFVLHQAMREAWPALRDLRPWERHPVQGDDWHAATQAWMAPAGHGVLLEHAPERQSTAWDLALSARLWGLQLVDVAALWREGPYLRFSAEASAPSCTAQHIANRWIVHDTPQLDALALLGGARACWRSHPAWFDRVHKGLLPELPLAPAERCVLAGRWRELDRPASELVLKPVRAWGGRGVRLWVTAAELDALPAAEADRWLVQPRYRALPLLSASDGAPLYGEIRCMVALPPGARPWVAARLARLSRGPLASSAGWRGLPGEGFVPVYAPPERGA
jgi:hypothetical protein